MKLIITEEQYKRIGGELTEVQGISYNARAWSYVIKREITKNNRRGGDIKITCKEHPEAYKLFPVDEIRIELTNDVVGASYNETDSGYYFGSDYILFFKFSKYGTPIDVINHELKHAYEDYMRKSKKLKPLSNTKEGQYMTGGFYELMTDKSPLIFYSFKPIFNGLYYTSKIERSAYAEQATTQRTDIIETLNKIMDTNYLRYYTYMDQPEKLWVRFKEYMKSPMLEKFKTCKDFFIWADKVIKRNGEKTLKKLRKIKYYEKTHGYEDTAPYKHNEAKPEEEWPDDWQIVDGD